jgi:hypothetical protein
MKKWSFLERCCLYAAISLALGFMDLFLNIIPRVCFLLEGTTFFNGLNYTYLEGPFISLCLAGIFFGLVLIVDYFFTRVIKINWRRF